MNSDNKYFDIKDFIPEKIISVKSGKSFSIETKIGNKYINISYRVPSYNQTGIVGIKEYSLTIPRLIAKNVRTFEVLGLLQAEMGKTNNGNLSFANHEYKLINYVLNWFEKEFEIDKTIWKWSIKLNIQQPHEPIYKELVESKVVKHWMERTKITLEQSYPKRVTYISNTQNTKLQDHDYGTLVLEHKHNLFSQIIKTAVRKITYDRILDLDKTSVQDFLRGIIAGEGCIELNHRIKKYVVHITALNEVEQNIYVKCLRKLGIEVNKYNNYKDITISKRKNNVHLLKQRLMTLSPQKYNKFLYMMKQYPKIKEETRYFKEKGQNIWNKIPKEKVNQIIQLYNSGITSSKEIAKKLNLHILKVQRVLKENNLGKRTIKTSESKRLEIFNYIIEHPTIPQKDIAILFKVHPAVVSRVWLKYKD